MGRLIYSGIASLDGYIADPEGKFDWAEPDDEVHGFVNDLDRDAGTYLYGRRTYELMIAWQSLDSEPGQTELMIDFARIWQAADKIVYSATLDQVSTPRTTLEREFDPDRIRALKESTDQDLLIGGPTLAAHAVRAGLVDRFQLFVNPVIIGGGTPYLPDDVRIELELVDEHRFAGGVVYLDYRAKP